VTSIVMFETQEAARNLYTEVVRNELHTPVHINTYIRIQKRKNLLSLQRKNINFMSD